MSNALMFPAPDLALEWADSRPGLMKFDAKRNEIQAVVHDIFELRAKVKQGADEAIAALEEAHTRLLNATHALEDDSLRTKLQIDLSVLERLLKQAKADLSNLL